MSEENNAENPKSNGDLAIVSSSGFKPFSEGNLDEQKEEIYKEQFHEENEYENGTWETLSGGAKKVLESLQKITTNPELFDYLLKCLHKQGVHLKNTYLAVTVEKPIYDTRPDSKLALLRMKEDNPKYVLKITLPFIFKSVSEIEEFINDKSYFTDERINFDDGAFMQGLKMSDLLFEKYTIKELGALAV